jgi:hypothetical protein
MTTNMSAIVLAGLTLLSFTLVLLVLYLRKQSKVSLTPVLDSILAVQKGQEQTDRSVREELARSREEDSHQSRALREEVVTALVGIGGTVSTNVETLTRSNDQKLELLRTAMEQRLDSFTTESSRKTDSLTQSVVQSTGKLHDEVSSKLAEFRTSLEGTVKSTHQVQWDTTESVSNAINTLLFKSDDRQLRLQTAIEGKLTSYPV